MIDPIQLKPISAGSMPLSAEKQMGAADLGKEFSSFMNDALNALNDKQMQADRLNEAFMKDELPLTDVHQLKIAADQAMILLETTVQIRNKAVEAYQEIMRMQI